MGEWKGRYCTEWENNYWLTKTFCKKGTNNCWFNTFNTSSSVNNTLVYWPPDLSFHALKTVLRTIPNDTSDIAIDYYMDGELKATNIGANFYGAPLWL